MNGTARRFSDGSVRITGVVDHSTPSAPVTVSSATAVTGRLYNGLQRSRVTATLAAAGTVLYVQDATHFAVGDSVEVRLDDTTTLHSTTIAGIPSTDEFVTLSDAIPAGRNAPAGTWLQKPIGSSFDMNTAYGTPAVNSYDWGFIGFYSDTIDLFDVEQVRIEVDFDGGTSKRLFKAVTVPVVTED